MTTDAVHLLLSAFAENSRDPGPDSVVISWPSVPVEIIRTAGFRPMFADTRTAQTPIADAVLEPGVFPRRLHQLVDAALSGRLSGAAAIVLPRTSDADYKAFLYLQEFRRRGTAHALPPVLLFDLLQSDEPHVAAYNAARMRGLLAKLADIAGTRTSTLDLGAQIAHSSGARAAMRRLVALRNAPVRLRGADALPMLGAFWSTPPARYATLANAAADALATRTPLAGARVLLAGAPVNSIMLHTAIESLHATVVDEVSPYGRDAAAGDVVATIDPFEALFSWYARHSVTARQPAAVVQRRVADSLTGIDAVVIHHPPDDARFGWAYPHLRALLEARGIPHTVLDNDPGKPLDEAHWQHLRRLLQVNEPLQAVGHG